MSAIAGILRFDGAVAGGALVGQLLDAMKACGPDAQMHWTHGPVALGHCMLRTTPEAAQEQQPVVNDDASVALVWDGRLDNREELQLAMADAGVTPRDASDAELVFQSYVLWSDRCPERLVGDFAFAVWDAARDRLFCARDHMGARPFFFTRTENFFAFASEDEALAALPGASRAVSDKHIAYHLVPSYLGFDYRHSWLKDVRALGAAQSMTVSPNGDEQISTYWQLTPGPEAAYASDEECEAAFLSVFTEAVRCRMRAAGGVAGMVSGGLDSASIATTVERLLPGMPGAQFHSYSAIADELDGCVESRCILSLTARLGGNAHTVSVPSFAGMVSVQDLVHTAWTKAHPIDNSLLLPALMCLAAARDGHRVMLTGVCGDLATHGTYAYLVALLKSRQWRLAWRECRSASRNNTYLQGSSPVPLYLRSIYYAFAPLWIRRAIRSVRRLLKRQSPREDSLISAQLAEKVGLDEWHSARDRQFAPFVADIQAAHIGALQPPHGIASSLGGYNRVAGKCGVELRDPWADRRVVEFWVRLPLKYKFREGWTKYLVRAALRNSMPAEVVWRVGKQHVGWNFFYRLMDESPEMIANALEHRMAEMDNFVNASAARRVHARYLATGDHEARESIFDLLTLLSWLERPPQGR